jgi:hypothetical protein
MKANLIFLIIIVSGFSSTSAQSLHSGWAGYALKLQSKSPWGIMFDIQARSSDDYEHLQQYIIRPGVSYIFSKKFIGAAGYAYVSNWALINNITGRIDEHRSWEQLIFNHKIGSINLTQRVRLEQRWISSIGAPDDYKTQQRFRYLIKGVLPFRKDSVFSKGFYGAVQDEVMFNYMNKATTNNSFFDQNRAYLALGYRLNPKFDLEMGYINQLVATRNGPAITNNIIQLAFYSRLDF